MVATTMITVVAGEIVLVQDLVQETEVELVVATTMIIAAAEIIIAAETTMADMVELGAAEMVATMIVVEAEEEVDIMMIMHVVGTIITAINQEECWCDWLKLKGDRYLFWRILV